MGKAACNEGMAATGFVSNPEVMSGMTMLKITALNRKIRGRREKMLEAIHGGTVGTTR
jgi:hypothetical protein